MPINTGNIRKIYSYQQENNMANLDEIREAYEKGQEAANDEDILSMVMHRTFGDAMAAMLPDASDDEEKAFRMGYQGEDLELCEECENFQEDCECEDQEDDE